MALGQPFQRGADGNAAPVPRRGGAVHVARGVPRVRPRQPARPRPRDGVRPLAARRARVRPVRHRQPDDPDHRPRAADRVRARAGRARGRGHRDVPDVLPGDDRDDPRPALVRPARARADALVRRLALRGLLEAAPAGVAAVPVHGAQDRRDGGHRRRDHRRGHGRHPGGPGPGHHRRSTSTTSRAREAVGGDLRRGDAGHRVLPPRPGRGDVRPARPARHRHLDDPPPGAPAP